MQVIDILALVSCLLLALSGWVYGAKFIRRKNYLLGLEWWVVGFSASNFLVFIATSSEFNYGISLFLDSFSRSFGMPIIATLGLMAVTHNYKPSLMKDLMLFAAAFAGTCFVYLSDSFDEPRPYFYVIMWSGYSIYLSYFIVQLMRAGEGMHALATAVGAAVLLAVAITYDFFPIPGDDTHMIFMTWAFFTWSYSAIQMYYAYCALERAKGVSSRSFVPAR
ncbi:hypothetical protein [Metapseudomonas furukawaii]|jgi:hypothetical protein|nr:MULTISPECIES: hypothetical protein [Pseudomonas]OWJ90185.1 hypothetical protein B6S59_28530 [Pseudomonas sp. A46]